MVSRVSKTESQNLVNLSGKFCGVLCLILLALCLTGNPGVTAAPPGPAIALGGMVCLFSGALIWSRGVANWPRVLWIAMGLTFWSLLSLTQSPAPYLSHLSLAGVCAFLGVLVGIFYAVQNREEWRTCATVLATGLFLSASHGLFQYYQQGSAGPLKSNFTNPDCFSLLLCLGVFLDLALLVEARLLPRVALSAAALIQVGALLLTASRAGAFAFLLGYCAYLFTLASSQNPRWRRVAVQLTILPLVTTLLLVGTGGGSLQLVEKWKATAKGEDVSNTKSRLDVLRYSYRTVARSPLFGSGIGCFHLAYQQDRPALTLGEDYMNVAHNDYVQWLVETGLPGGILWAILLLGTIRLGWRSYRSPTPFVAGQVASTVCIGTYCAFNFATPVYCDFVWIGASIGLTCCLPSVERSKSDSPWNPRAFPLGFALILLGGCTTLLGSKYISLQSSLNSAASLAATADWESSILSLETAAAKIATDPNPQIKIAEMAHRIFLFSGEIGWLQKEEASLLAAHNLSPKNLSIIIKLCRFYEEQGRVAESRRYVNLAQQLAPYSPHIRRELVRVLIFEGELAQAADGLASIESVGITVDDHALALLVAALEKKQSGKGLTYIRRIDTVRALAVGLEASEIASREGNYPVASRILADLASSYPENPRVLFELALSRGLAGNPKKELELIEKLKQSGLLENDLPTGDKVWRRWAEIRLGQKKKKLVLTQLQDYLLTHPRGAWARSMTAQIQVSLGNKAEARAALREGIPYDNDGSLRLELADLCAAQGLRDLAFSYYKEAQKYSRDQTTIASRLRNLKLVPREDAEGLVDPSESD